MSAVAELIEEHEGVVLSLKILEAICEQIQKRIEINLDHADNLINFFQVFVDKCHHSKEEDFLFPLMKKLSPQIIPLIDELIGEHQKGRQYAGNIAIALKNCREGMNSLQVIKSNGLLYISLLKEHINRENNKLFPFADKMTGKENDRLIEEFEAIEREKIGQGRHDKFHKMLNNLSSIYL